MSIPITPENATPDRCAEVADAYSKYLLERSTTSVAADPERAKKVEGSIRWCEQTLGYWMSFLLAPDGSTDPLTDEVRWQLSELRRAYAGTYAVPDISAQAFTLAQAHHRRTRQAAKAAVARTPSPVAPQPPAPEESLEAVLARTFGMTVEQLRAAQAE